MPQYNYPGYTATSHGFMELRPTSTYGYHGGVDSPAAPGTPVYGEYDGTVFRSGPINGYGMSVVVQSTAADGSTFYELYGHLGPGPLPVPGTDVSAGNPIPGAVIGSQSYVNSFPGANIEGSHLHREIISGNAPINSAENLGLVSSDVTYRANPNTFNINNPFFPNMPGAVPLPQPRPDLFGQFTSAPPYIQETISAERTMFGNDFVGASAGSFAYPLAATLGNGNGELPTLNGYSVPQSNGFPVATESLPPYAQAYVNAGGASFNGWSSVAEDQLNGPQQFSWDFAAFNSPSVNPAWSADSNGGDSFRLWLTSHF